MRPVSATMDGLLRGVGNDLRDYRALLDLLESQFAAALRHETAHLADVGERVTALVETLEQRRVQRVELAERLLGPGARMPAVIAAFDLPQRRLLADGWSVLEELVGRCKALNERNCRLLTSAYASWVRGPRRCFCSTIAAIRRTMAPKA